MDKLPHFFIKKKPKLSSEWSKFQNFGNINSIPKVKEMELEGKKGSKLAKI